MLQAALQRQSIRRPIPPMHPRLADWSIRLPRKDGGAAHPDHNSAGIVLATEGATETVRDITSARKPWHSIIKPEDKK
jgi:hypothetical protein